MKKLLMITLACGCLFCLLNIETALAGTLRVRTVPSATEQKKKEAQKQAKDQQDKMTASVCYNSSLTNPQHLLVSLDMLNGGKPK